MEQLARIGDHVSFAECETAGVVREISAGHLQVVGRESMLVYEIETVQGTMRIPADWLHRLARP